MSVKVLKVDPATGKISLGMKQLAIDPWSTLGERLKPGDRFEGKVARVAEFGAFVEIEPGVEGLVHVSELGGGRREKDARKLIQSGEALLVKVLEVDFEKRRIALARIEAGAVEEAPLEPGSLFKGTVDRIEPYGIFVRLGPGRTGLVPTEELGLARGQDVKRDLPVGSEVPVEILAVEEGGKRIRLSRARALTRSDRAEVERFRVQEAERAGSGFSTLGDAFRTKVKDGSQP